MRCPHVDALGKCFRSMGCDFLLTEWKGLRRVVRDECAPLFLQKGLCGVHFWCTQKAFAG